MSTPRLRVLLLGDTHLGLDLPQRPRIQRRRRGPELFAGFQRALRPALRKEVDLVVHGGDLFDRSRVPRALAQMAAEPLLRVADSGVPVLLVPGNHERSRIPHADLMRHPNLHLFERPMTVTGRWGGVQVAVAGFPFARQVDPAAWGGLLRATGWDQHRAQVRLLCVHQAVEGARVGPHEYTFRRGRDVVAGRCIPAGLAAVLSGHIHRCQVLTDDLAGRALAAPVLYAGSVDRTAFAERGEQKCTLRLELEPGGAGGRLVSWRRTLLPTRPMVLVELDSPSRAVPAVEAELRRVLARQEPDAIVQLSLAIPPTAALEAALSARRLRQLAPASMNVSVSFRPGREASSAATALATGRVM